MQKFKKPISILLVFMMIVSLFAIVPLSASAAYWYSDLARGTLIRPGDTFSFEDIGSFKFADYNDPTIIHEVKGSDFSYNQETLSVTDGYYSFGSTKLLPTSVSPGGLLIADYDSTTKMATFGVQNITHSFDETTGTLTIGGSGVVTPNYAFTGSDVYDVVFTQSNLVKHLIIDATDMIAIKQDAFMAYTGGCVLEDVEINSTSSTPLIIEENAVFYESDNTVTITVNAVKLATVTNSPVNNYGSPVNLIYNVEQPITFEKNALTEPWGDLTVTFPAGCKIFIPGGPQFTDSELQDEYDMLAEHGDDEFFWRRHSDLVEGTDYVFGDARYEELTPLNASLVVGNDNTALFSAYTITDESVNGTVTASVNGTDVTEAAADADVLLTVAPDNGYQFKSISATYPKNKVEEFSDLVAMMGDAVFSAADYADHPEYTCKVNDGKFVVYDGDTSVAELSEANMTNAELGGTYFSAQCGGLEWNLYFSDGRITDIYVYDSDYNYIFPSADGSKSTGTLLPVVVNLTTVTEGSQYSLTMPKMPVTVKAEFEAIPTYTVTWKNGDTVLETDTDVAEGTTPSYDGETPYKADGADCIYTFSGWNDGTTTYAPNELPAVSGNVTYTATFTESEKPETIKDCTNKFGDFRLYANVPLVQFSGFEELPNGAVLVVTYRDNNTMIPVQDAKGYSYKFYDQTGTELTTEIANSNTEPGSNFGFGDDVTVYAKTINFTRLEGTKAIYIVATAPAPTPTPAKLTLNVGENGKVVMDNGTFGNATDASNIPEIPVSGDVPDGGIVIIADGHSVNFVEGGSINIAAGGEVSFYPSADNTGKITAIPNEGYICTGWYNGDTRYTKKDTIDYQNISEDMTLTAKFAPKLFPQHSVTLGGDIGVNFYINPAAAGANEHATVSVEFSWNGQTKTVVAKYDGDEELFKATCDVVAAEVACDITAVATVNGEVQTQTDTYSVQKYAEAVYNNPTEYDTKGRPEKLQALAKALLNYGAMAQTVFVEYMKQPVKAPADIVSTVEKTNFDLISADDIPGGATDLKDIATQLGCQYYTSSVLYLSKNTLRLYFTPNTYQGTMPHVNDFKGNQSEYYYYVEKENIAAAELDNQQKFTIGGKEFTFSALDYAKAVVNSDMGGDKKDLAKSLYLYNKAANEYFDDAPAPAENEVISSGFIEDFSTLNVGDYIAKGVGYAADNDYKVVLTGGTYGTESRDGIVVRNGDYNFNAGEYGMGTYSYHVPQPNVFIEDYNENEKFYPAVDGVEGNAFVVVAKDDTQKIITIAGANVTQN